MASNCLKTTADPGTFHAPTLRVASPEDYPDIRTLLISNDLRAASLERWVQLWRDNPARRGWPNTCPIGWVLESDRGEIVGYMGNIPLAYRFKERELRAVTGSGLAVSKGYRAYAMLLVDCLIQQEGIDLVINATVSPVAESIVSFFEFSRVPAGTWNKAAFWITTCREFSRSVLRTKSIPAASALSYIAAPILYCRNSFQPRLRNPKSTIEKCSEFDERFDAFWEQLKTQKENVLLGVRTRETLAWHFQYALSQRNAWVLTASAGRHLVAYAIFDRRDSAALQLKRIRLIDFQALEGSEHLLSAFLDSMLSTCRRENIHVLEVTGCWLDRLSLPEISPPYHRNLACWTSYYLARNKELGETLKDPNVWAPSGFDGDSSL